MRKLVCFISVLAFVFLSACDKDNSPNNIDILEKMEESNLTILVKGTLDSRANGAPEDGTPQESNISQLEFYIFNEDGSQDGVRPYHVVNGYSGGNISFTVESGMKKILVAANMNLGAPETTAVYDTVKGWLYDGNGIPMIYDNSRIIPTAGLPMTGKGEVVVRENVTNNRVTVYISRLVSKVYAPIIDENVVINIPQEELKSIFGEDVAAQPTFTFKSYALINGLDASDAFMAWNDDEDEDMGWDKWVRKSPVLSQFSVAKELVSAYSGQEGADNWWLSGNTDVSDFVLVYENDPDPTEENGLKGFVKNSVYAFLIKGTLNVEGVPIDRYWRVNLIYDDLYKIYRNTIYRVTINNISTIGYGNAQDAEEDSNNGNIVPSEEQTGLIVTVEVNPWRVKNQEVGM